MAQTVIGIFDYTNEAQAAVEHLVNNGFSRDRIDISARNSDNDSTNLSGSSTSSNDNDHDSGISNFFSSLFGNDDEANNYTEVARRGSIVTVHAQSSDESERAATILDQYGAVDVDERASQYRNYSGTETDRTSSDTTNRAIPIIEENLEVGKRVVESGGARLRSRIVERPVEESIRLRSERVSVERNPVNRAATQADLENFRDATIEVTEHTEVPVVGKETRVVEEVSLNKEVEENQETIRDTVRKTEVDVEKLDTDEELRRRSSSTRTDNDSDLI